jgi:hypothetical protein
MAGQCDVSMGLVDAEIVDVGQRIFLGVDGAVGNGRRQVTDVDRARFKTE